MTPETELPDNRAAKPLSDGEGELLGPRVPSFPTVAEERGRRLFFRILALAVLGLALLVLMWSIRSFALGSAEADKSAVSGKKSEDDAVFCFGLVDFERGAVSLAPLHAGRVAQVLVRENQHVPAGTVLLRLEDRQAQIRVASAQASVETAQALVAQALKQPRRLESQRVQQQAAVEAARYRVIAAQQALDRKQRLDRENLIARQEVAIAAAQVEELKAVQQAEEARLAELKDQDSASALRRAEADLATARANLDQAQQTLDECALKAPRDGMVLRLLVNRGDVLGEQAKKPAVLFGPDGPRVIRAEIDQEFARGLQVGQAAEAQDDVHPDHVWKGTVTYVSNWYLQRREVLDEMQQNQQTRTLECLIALAPDQPPLRIGQRMRVTIKREVRPPD